jgi:hypothetical protein
VLSDKHIQPLPLGSLLQSHGPVRRAVAKTRACRGFARCACRGNNLGCVSSHGACPRPAGATHGGSAEKARRPPGPTARAQGATTGPNEPRALARSLGLMVDIQPRRVINASVTLAKPEAIGSMSQALAALTAVKAALLRELKQRATPAAADGTVTPETGSTDLVRFARNFPSPWLNRCATISRTRCSPGSSRSAQHDSLLETNRASSKLTWSVSITKWDASCFGVDIRRTSVARTSGSSGI